MKICPRCQMGNSNETVMCRECGASLGAAIAQDAEAILKAASDRYERKQRRIRILKVAWVVLASVLHIIFFVIAIIRGTFIFPVLLLLFMPVGGYMMLFHAEAMFQFKIDASGDYEIRGEVGPSEWYLFKSTIAGSFIMLASTIFMGIAAF